MLVKDKAYQDYFEEQQKIGQELLERMNAAEIRGKEDLARFAEANGPIAEELRESLERAMLKYRLTVLKSRPSDNAARCVDLLMDVDARLFSKMSAEEKDEFRARLEELERIIKGFQSRLDG